MKNLLLIFLAILFLASFSFAQNGNIIPAADAEGLSCYLDDTAPGLFTAYIVHAWTPGATASQFMISMSPGFTATPVGETYNFTLSLGTFASGISISYQACLSGTIALGSMTFYGSGTSSPCSYLQAVPDPLAVPAGSIWTVDCSQPEGTLVPAAGGIVWVNSDFSTCDCEPPVERKSWGAIKALYN